MFTCYMVRIKKHNCSSLFQIISNLSKWVSSMNPSFAIRSMFQGHPKTLFMLSDGYFDIVSCFVLHTVTQDIQRTPQEFNKPIR